MRKKLEAEFNMEEDLKKMTETYAMKKMHSFSDLMQSNET